MIILERTGAGDLETRLIAALATCGVAVPITDRDDVHIQSAVAATWRRISEAVSDVEESLADLRTPVPDGWNLPPACTAARHEAVRL